MRKDKYNSIYKGDDSFDRILQEEGTDPDPNTAVIEGSRTHSDSHKAIQDNLQKASQQLSTTVQKLATVKAAMTDVFSK